MITNRWFVLLDALLDLWTVTVATLEVTAIGWNFAALFVATDSTLTSSGVPERNSTIFHNYLGCLSSVYHPKTNSQTYTIQNILYRLQTGGKTLKVSYSCVAVLIIYDSMLDMGKKMLRFHWYIKLTHTGCRKKAFVDADIIMYWVIPQFYNKRSYLQLSARRWKIALAEIWSKVTVWNICVDSSFFCIYWLMKTWKQEVKHN